jgi:membrane-bound lytic murein transglycosylase B
LAPAQAIRGERVSIAGEGADRSAVSSRLWSKFASQVPPVAKESGAFRVIVQRLGTSGAVTVPVPSIRRKVWSVFLLAAFLLSSPAFGEPSDFQNGDFQNWVGELRREALAGGVSAATFDRAFAGVAPIERVIELDRRQPEFTQTFWQYLDKRVTPERIERGRAQLAKHRKLLESVQRRYGVQPRFLVAFWALESNFGDYTGTFPAVAALATLAFDERRGTFFRQQLLALLAILDKDGIPVDANSSWAGAMGQPQFIPTTYRDFAVDFDGDGKRDLWKSLPDVFGSSANYLASAGWQGNRTWGREVRLPADFDFALADLEIEKPLAEWQRLGVRKANGGDLPRVDISGSIILPGGATGGPALMVYRNFRAIMTWNRSLLYAAAVGHLADRLAGEGTLTTPRPAKEVPLSRSEITEIQHHLDRLGFDAGSPDGVVGPKTRKAIKSFQQHARLPADGFPTIGLLERLRSTAGN